MPNNLAHYATQALYLSLMLSLPSILVAAAVGTLFAIVQALTQIQEQTLSYVAKLVATFATLLLTLRWMSIEIYQYATILFGLIPGVGAS
ncbi:type III secretion system export apparatus subunit SctS [Noviherbaspirillum sp.]|uniref:type III secretion system export apparatus subunit SctS n=1 Tax=Noviherbaspirillum sp. TaxID=1926288 RepID=UPI002B482E70|nr:type III secretion system export apparatus subunit SctS [Noviherbaspirillum sp.]HJV80569.1 type III secretion system export apparatus subunit SctS [Noviherbaspirillum sp.]